MMQSVGTWLKLGEGEGATCEHLQTCVCLYECVCVSWQFMFKVRAMKMNSVLVSFVLPLGTCCH